MEVSNDRMKWLTCARILSAAERIGSEIIMNSHKNIYIEYKQYWRNKFNEVIIDFPQDFYTESIEAAHVWDDENRSPISFASIYAIHKFMMWDVNYTDPLTPQELSAEERLYIKRMYPNLDRYIEDTKRFIGGNRV